MSAAPFDLLVVGAGPAGVAAAITAQRRGLSVALVDRATFPRDKTCGDGLTAAALRHLEDLGVTVPGLASAQPITTVVVRSPSGRAVELPFPGGGHYAMVTTRLDLDAALVDRAADVGIPVITGAAVTAIEMSPAGVHVGTGDATFHARFVIGADGHYSAVRRLVAPDAEHDLGSSHAFRQYFTGVDEDRLWVVFERDLLPGYAWVFPLPGGRANVGLGVVQGGSRDARLRGKDLAARWREVLARPSIRAILGPRAEPEAPRRAWPIPAAFDPRRCTAGRVLFAGDAASVVDPMTGEGVAQALESGMLAAHAVADGGPVAAVAARYRTTIDRELGRDLRFARRVQRILRTPTSAAGALALVDTSAWTRRNFARWMFEDYPRALLLTPDRWRSGALTPAGAYAS